MCLQEDEGPVGPFGGTAWTAKRPERAQVITLRKLNPPATVQASRNHGRLSPFISIASLGLVYPVAFKCRMGAKKGATKMGRQTESYLDTRAIYSEAEYLKAVLFWLQGQSGPLGGVPKAESNPRDGMLDGIAFLPARSSYE